METTGGQVSQFKVEAVVAVWMRNMKCRGPVKHRSQAACCTTKLNKTIRVCVFLAGAGAERSIKRRKFL